MNSLKNSLNGGIGENIMEEFVMYKKIHLAGLVILLVAVLALSACNAAPPPPAPTADANAVYTQAAATVAANLTQSANQNPAPTSTFPPPTETPTAINAQPSATLAQPGPGNTTQTATVAANTNTTPAANTTVTATLKAGVTVVPTATKAAGAPAPATGDKAAWVSQGPNDGASIPVSATFNVIYTLKNTGTTTWTTKYSLRYYAGDKMSSPNDTSLTKEVKPGETVSIPFLLIAPDGATKTHTIWTLSNADGVNFYYVTMDLEIK
jgi:hypothetical protein